MDINSVLWIVFILIVLVLCFVLMWTKKGKQFTLSFYREKAYRLMLAIEKRSPEILGGYKRDWVVEHLYMMLPKIFRVFIKRQDIIKFMQLLFDTIKDYLDNGSLDKSIKGSGQ